MIPIDIIMLASSSNEGLYKMTKQALASLKESETDYSFEVKLVESHSEAHNQGFSYPEALCIFPNEPFHYNKFLNRGLEYCSREWVVVVNNDVIFYPGWFSAMMNYHKNNPDVKSFSPCDPLHEDQLRKGHQGVEGLQGYEIRHHVKGWCIASHRELIDSCKLFDESFPFWYQDDDYAETIKRAGYKHALVLDSLVRHFSGQSTELFKDEKINMTMGQRNTFKNKWG
jgi:GT2 family glycosyltransferase